ncbi:MAG: hypothetical protein HXX13_11765 [Bacteroidetes bacterium]|nr:hypothetical protein [Bacteroidota bacterium]
MDSPILNLVILLTFTYFTSSLILSSINEGITQGIFHLREKNLKKAIELLFISKEWRNFIRTDFEKSPHIQSLMHKSGKYPVYIPANNFFLFVIEKIGAPNFREGNLQNAIQGAEIPEAFKKVLQDLAAKSGNKLRPFETSLTQFYDDALEHSTVWYRKKVRRILLLLGFVLAIGLNIDTIKIANDALSDKNELSKNVDNIVAMMPNISMSHDSTTTIRIWNEKGQVLVSQQVDPIVMPGRSSPSDSTSSKGNVNKLRIMYEESAGYFLGYRPGEFGKEWFGQGWIGFSLKFLGVLITAFAVQLGSNFWFDIMKKALSIRAPIKKNLNSDEDNSTAKQ